MEMFNGIWKDGAEVLSNCFSTEFEPAKRGNMSIWAIREGVYIVNFWIKVKT
jgi:hypothetical protein